MPTLSSLIEEVEHSAPSTDPLAQLETASATAQQVDEVTDSMLSHFVDKCRRAGHSWAEIGGALGVSKQAVQKRFTTEMLEPQGWDRFTPRARRLVTDHAPAAAESLGHNWVGTEHLLLGFYAEPEAIAPRVLEGFGLDRDTVVAGINRRIAPGASSTARGPFTPRAWAALASTPREAVDLGHNYVGTEHQLLALFGVGGVGAEILADADITHDRARAKVVELLIGQIVKGSQ
ncbi:MAG: Clp protease N-terminal domain-containing protein [Acidimicrobiia bacterium]